MDAEEQLRKYISPRKGARIVGLIALVIGLIGAVMLVLKLAAPAGKATEFNKNANGTSQWCYLDVAGISDWAFKDDGKVYYIAEDAYGSFYVVRLKSSTFKKMSAQRAYWEEETSTASPMQINGVPRTATTVMKDYISRAAGIDQSSYKYYFGTYYLDATSKPGSDEAYIWGIPGVFGLILAMILLPTSASARKKAEQAIESLGSYERQLAAAELEAPTTHRENKDRLRLGEHWLFGKRQGLLLPYDRVVWVYEQVQRTNFIVTARHLFLADDRGHITAAASFGRNGHDEILRLIGEIAARNPAVMTGFSAENRKKWQEIVKERKAS